MFQADTPFKSFDAERTARFAAGVASPLWAPFLVAASAGVAFWWMTGWTRREAGTVLPLADEPKSFAPAAAANDAEFAAPEAEVDTPDAAVEAAPAAIVQAPPAAEPAQAEAVIDADPLAEAEAALAETQQDVARLAAEAATAELADPKPRRSGKKA